MLDLAVPAPLSRPQGIDTSRIVWPYAITLVLYHLLALLCFVPALFSWANVALMLAGLYVFGTLGINLCFHRLLTHRGMVCPRWLEYSLAILGVCCMQDTPAHWVAIHRLHHAHSDKQEDPHSPLVNFMWGHMGWMIVENRDISRLEIYSRFAKDLLRKPFYKQLEGWLFPVVVFGSWIVFFLGGLLYALASGDGLRQALLCGVSVLVWGVLVRTVLVWHITWSVNSVAHLWGYQNYDTGERSRNNWFVALIAAGEGWHNNHHAQPRSAKHGHRWFELDLTYATIRLLEKMGLATQVVRPDPTQARDIRA
jgi:stearoyl-CoA desaturase (delta-9 desaturase)